MADEEKQETTGPEQDEQTPETIGLEQDEQTPETTDAEQDEQTPDPVEVRTAKNTVAVEDVGPCKKKVTIEIPEETIKEMADEQYLELRREAALPGFRKGRAPRRLLEKRFGKETSEQIKLRLLAESSEAAIKGNELDVLGDPDIDHEHIELPESGPMRFDFEVEVRPEFELPSLEGIPVTKPTLAVDDEQVEREIEQLRRWGGTWTVKEDDAIEREDQIIADVRLNVELTEEEKAKRDAIVEGTEEEGSEPANLPEAETKLDNAEIYVRPNGFVGPIPVEKLDEVLIGAKAGEKKTTTVEVPQTFFREDFQGRKVDIEIDIKDVKYLKPAELNEAFLQRHGVESEDDMRNQVRENLEQRVETQARNDMSEQIHKHLIDNAQIELPMDIVARQAGSLLQRQYLSLLYRGLSREQVDEQMEQLRASSEEQAKEQLKTFFVMDKVADQLDIEVSDEEVNGHLAQMAIQQNQRPERLREQMERDGSLAQFHLEVRQNKCISKLLESAKITECAPDEKAENGQ